MKINIKKLFGKTKNNLNKSIELIYLSLFILVPILFSNLNQQIENFSEYFDCISIKNNFINKFNPVEGEYNLNIVKSNPIWIKSNNNCFITQVSTDSKHGNHKLWLLQCKNIDNNGTTLHLYNTDNQKNPPFSNWKSPRHIPIPKAYNIKPEEDFFEFSKEDHSGITITNCYKSPIVSKRQMIFSIAIFMILLGAVIGLYLHNKNEYNV